MLRGMRIVQIYDDIISILDVLSDDSLRELFFQARVLLARQEGSRVPVRTEPAIAHKPSLATGGRHRPFDGTQATPIPLKRNTNDSC